MIRKLIITASALFLLAALPALAQTNSNCNNLPTQFTGNDYPTGDFFSNFNNPCYLIPIDPGNGMNGQSGDLNALYNRIYFKVNPNYQFIIIGTFPNARYFSVTVYDEHSAISQSLLDTNITPLSSQYINPYQPGMNFVPGQQYGAAVNFGGTLGATETGCTISSSYNVDANAFDATLRHPGMDWNWDSAAFQAMPGLARHVIDDVQHTNPNKAGAILIRNYLDIDPAGSVPLPSLIVRDVATGCAYPATYALNTLQIVTEDQNTGNSWLDNKQVKAHNYYFHGWIPKVCYTVNPDNLLWLRGSEYTAGEDPGSASLMTSIPTGLPTTLAAAGEVMRIRARLPITPPTPCAGACSRTGTEQLRYMSLSFQSTSGFTLASVADNAFTQDPAGYVTLIVGTGAAIPSWVTPANGYTFLDLTALSGYQNLSALNIRNILTASTFRCSGEIVPYNTGAYSPAGGLMGEYLPVVDYPLASSLPTVAVPLVGPNTCGIFPNGQAGPSPTCGITSTPPIAIQTLTTQCNAPGCNQVIAQPLPPITIAGAGFGNFPDNLPFSGNSNYLEIINTTKMWDAGNGTDACNVSITSWYYNFIELVPEIGGNTLCPLSTGDQLTVKVWNPQNPAAPAAVTTTTVGGTLSFSSSSLSFGNVLPGNSVTLTETITNNSSTNFKASTVTITGGFTFTNNCTASVPPGSSCSISVTFAPTAGGIATGVLTITNNIQSPLNIALSGTGVGVLLNLSQTIVTGGNSIASNTISQLYPAPAGGETITLSSSNPAAVAPPPSVTIAPGATVSAPFTITSTPVATTTSVMITATYSGIATTVTVNVNAAILTQLNLASSTMISGLSTNLNNVALNAPAPAGGTVVNLSVDNPAVATVPASVTIPANSQSAGFTITAGFVTQPTSAVITATYGSAVLTATLTVTPVAVASVKLYPTSLIGGDQPSSPNNIVALNAPAPPGGALVILSSSNPAVASVPASVTVPAGVAPSPSFVITTTPVAAATPVTISATYGGATQSATLTVLPPSVYNVRLYQTTIKGGKSISNNDVELNGPAPTGGAVISLVSSNPAVAAVPATVTVNAGSTVSAHFTITTTNVKTNTTVTISATYQGSTQSATLTVTP